MSVHPQIEIGSEFVGYRLEEVVGRGGMGVVYRAHDLRLKRTVALKLMAPELALDERFRERFSRESELAMSLEHPNVVPIHDAGEFEGRLYLAMRHVEGTDLKALLREEELLGPARALAITAQIANALDAAHAKGLVHRDVKPSNVLLDPDQHAYLADFGLTRRLSEQGVQSGDGRSMGTPSYLAPEQIEGGPVDGRADIYSLGCLLYECLTGEAPFARDSRLAVAWAHLEEEPPSIGDRVPQLPAAIDDVIHKAMAKDPEERYATCGELIAAAEDALGLGPVAPPRRRRLAVAVAVLAALTALAALASAFSDRGRGEAASSTLTARKNTVMRIDPTTNAIKAVVDVGEQPDALAVAGRSVWAYNLESHTVSEIDAATNQVRRTIAMSSEYGDLGGPVIAADDAGAWAIGHRVATEDYVLTRILAGSQRKREYRLDLDPNAVAVGEGAVWVLGWARGRGAVVDRIDGATGKVTGRTVIPSYGQPQNLAVGEGAVWALDSNAELFRIDPRSRKVTGRRDLGECAAMPVVAFGSLWACVCNPGSSMLRIDPKTLRNTLSRNAIPAQEGNFTAGNGSLWWHDARNATVLRFNPTTGDLTRTIRVTPSAPTPYSRSLTTRAISAGPGGVWVALALN